MIVVVAVAAVAAAAAAANVAVATVAVVAVAAPAAAAMAAAVVDVAVVSGYDVFSKSHVVTPRPLNASITIFRRLDGFARDRGQRG